MNTQRHPQQVLDVKVLGRLYHKTVVYTIVEIDIWIVCQYNPTIDDQYKTCDIENKR
jgi:hypothetical protein